VGFGKDSKFTWTKNLFLCIQSVVSIQQMMAELVFNLLLFSLL